MIIKCINCNKKFEVNSDLIPEEGRTIQCGSCNHTWFFRKNTINKPSLEEKEDLISINSKEIKDEKIQIKKPNRLKKNTEKALVKYQKKNKYSLGKFVRHIIVFIISLIALIIFLDTLKLPLSKFFPNLEFLLFNLYETIKDIFLFLQNLIN